MSNLCIPNESFKDCVKCLAHCCRDPLCVARVVGQLGPLLVLRWMAHFFALGAFTAAHLLLAPLRPLAPRSWHLRRLLEALEYGCGADGDGGERRGPAGATTEEEGIEAGRAAEPVAG